MGARASWGVIVGVPRNRNTFPTPALSKGNANDYDSHPTHCRSALRLFAAGSQPLHATTLPVVDSLGFETPFTTTFAPMGGGGYAGQLEGQVPGPVAPTAGGTWLQTSNAGTSTATIQTAVVDTGAQAVRVNHTSGSENRWGVPVSGWPNFGPLTQTPPGPLRYICIDWSMNVTASTAGGLGPFFGIDANDDDFNPISRLGFAGVNSVDGEIVYDTPTGLFTSGVFAPLGAWNDYRMVLDYATDSYGFMVNGILATPGWVPFVDDLINELRRVQRRQHLFHERGCWYCPGHCLLRQFHNRQHRRELPRPGTLDRGFGPAGCRWLGLASPELN